MLCALFVGTRMYVDIRDNMSELLGDRWYFIHSNVWLFPYDLAIVGLPLCGVVGGYSALAKFLARHKAAMAELGGGAPVSLTVPMDGFVGLYVVADGISSVVHAAIANCVWSTRCPKDEFWAAFIVSMIVFAFPLGLMLLRRQITPLFRWQI